MHKIYVIDTEENTKLYSHLITRHGFLLFLSSDVDQAISEIQEEKPALILLNIDSSDDDDLTLMQMLLELQKDFPTSILPLTATEDSARSLRALDLCGTQILLFPPIEDYFTTVIPGYIKEPDLTIETVFRKARDYEHSEDFYKVLIPIIAKHLQVDKVALIMMDEDGKYIVPLAAYNISPLIIKKAKFQSTNSLVKTLRKFSKPIRTNKLFSDLRFMEVSFDEKEKLLQMEADVVVPLHFLKEFRGILLIGKKTDQSILEAKDLTELTSIGNKICSALYDLEGSTLEESALVDTRATFPTEREVGQPSGPSTVRSDASSSVPSILPSIEFEPGHIFADRFVIKQLLGKGNLGVVYLVDDRELDEQVVIKVIDPAIAALDNEIELLKKNLIQSRKAHHNTIAPYFDLTEAGDYCYSTMAYLEGKTLKQVLAEENQLPVNKALIIIKQICAALQAMHEVGLYHGNLKPNNIIIDEKLNVKVLDLGMGRQLDFQAKAEDDLIHETAEYISPEIASGDKMDHRTDIYTLGIIMYKMFTGIVPFKSDTPIATALLHVDSSPMSPRKFNTYIPFTIEEIILKCLEKQPQKRFQRIDDVLIALDRLKEEMSEGVFDDRIVAVRQSDQIALLLKKGEQFYQEGRYLDCITEMKTVLSIVPQHIKAREMIEAASRELELASDPEKATLASASADEILTKAQQLLNEGHYQQSVDAIKIAMQKEPGHKKAGTFLAQAQRKLLEEEIRIKKEEEKQRQRDIKQLFKDAKRAFKANNFEESIDLLEKLLNLDPTNSSAQKMLQKAQSKWP
ncbi:protein kinase [bacterium]|nr:protein kinase [bacterium]